MPAQARKKSTRKAVVVEEAAPEPVLVEADPDGPASNGERHWAWVTHALGIFTLFVGPLLLYFVKKGRASPWLRAHLTESINYHILLVAAFILIVVGLVFLSQITIVATVLMIVAGLLVLAHVVFGVLAVIQAVRGRSFHYPLDVKLVR